MKPERQLTIAAIAFLTAAAAPAQTVYKSVDAQGRVTYSSSPPPATPQEMVEQVEIAPGPTEQQRQDAEQRAKEFETVTKRAEQEIQEQSAQSSEAASDADLELRKAQIALEEARIKGDDDWQYLATGGRVLKQSYLDRVGAAERRVKHAQDSQRGARSSRR